jgi:hypothetical protein
MREPAGSSMRAADLGRNKGFRVLSFRHLNDDTFLTARRGSGTFSLKIDDRGRVLAIVPMGRTQSSPGGRTTRDRDHDRR